MTQTAANLKTRAELDRRIVSVRAAQQDAEQRLAALAGEKAEHASSLEQLQGVRVSANFFEALGAGLARRFALKACNADLRKMIAPKDHGWSGGL